MIRVIAEPQRRCRPRDATADDERVRLCVVHGLIFDQSERSQRFQ
jgi:hypothetical protein